MKRLQPEILEKHAAILSRLLADEEMFWRVGRSLAMLLHRNTAQMGSLKGNANKIFLLYISQHFVVTFPIFLGLFLVERRFGVQLTNFLRGLECASCSPQHPFKVNSSCLAHMLQILVEKGSTTSCYHVSMLLEAVEIANYVQT